MNRFHGFNINSFFLKKKAAFEFHSLDYKNFGLQFKNFYLLLRPVILSRFYLSRCCGLNMV